MVDSIQGAMPSFGNSPFQSQPLTDDQKSQVQSILSKYDPNNLTADDAKSIFKAFRDAGIQPGKDLMDTVQSAGFDASKLRELARPAGHHGHGHHHSQSSDSTNSSSGIDMNALQSLQSILSQYDLTNMSSDQQQSLVTQLGQAGLMNNGNMIDISA